jgi:crossover junction endodeoxyribonuclease RuvC
MVAATRSGDPAQADPGGEAEPPATRVLGVDPGLTRTGWALVVADGRRYRVLGSGVVAPRADGELAGRLADGYRRFGAILEQQRPDLVVMEDLFTTPRFPRSALKMAHLRGVLCLAAELAGVPVLSLTATTVKQRITGNGHASKEQVQRVTFHLCEIEAAGVPSDLSDAIALAIAGLHQATGVPARLAGRR